MRGKFVYTTKLGNNTKFVYIKLGDILLDR